MHFHAGIEKKDAYKSELEPSNQSVSKAVPASKFPQMYGPTRDCKGGKS
jgi:hypothetical protein